MNYLSLRSEFLIKAKNLFLLRRVNQINSLSLGNSAKTSMMFGFFMTGLWVLISLLTYKNEKGVSSNHIIMMCLQGPVVILTSMMNILLFFSLKTMFLQR